MTKEVSSRDGLIDAFNRAKAEAAAERAELDRQLAEAQKKFDEWERPKRELERIGKIVQERVGRALAEQGNLKREIESAIPEVLSEAIISLRQDLSVRRGDRRANAESALIALDSLKYQAGDLRPAIKKILSELLKADLSLL